MATKDDDDMPVVTRRLLNPPEDTSFWPEIEAKEEVGLSTPWTQAIKDVLKFLDIEEPYSVEADEDGIQLAEFLIDPPLFSIGTNS